MLEDKKKISTNHKVNGTFRYIATKHWYNVI